MPADDSELFDAHGKYNSDGIIRPYHGSHIYAACTWNHLAGQQSDWDSEKSINLGLANLQYHVCVLGEKFGVVALLTSITIKQAEVHVMIPELLGIG